MAPKPWYESRSTQAAGVFGVLVAGWVALLWRGVAVPPEIPALVSAAFAAFVAARGVQRSKS